MNVTDKLPPDRIDPRTIPEGIRKEALLRGLFSAVPEAVVLLDMHDRILKVNPEFTKIFGYAQEEACGHLINELIVPEELSAEAEEYTRRGLRGDSVNVETVRKHKDGKRIHVSMISGPVWVADSHISYYAIYRDITERKRAEQRLRESEAYLAEAQRLSQTGSWAWNPATGDIRYCSEMCCRVLGFDHAGSPPRFEELFQRLHPDDQAASRERFEKGIRDKADFEWDYRIVHPEKGIRDIHTVGRALLDGSGNLSEFVGTVIDVTERKRAEKQLQRSESYLSEAQKLSHTGTAGWDIASREIYWSQETFRIYELDPTTKVTSELIAQRTHPQDRSAVQEVFERALREQTEFDLEHRILMSDGSIKYLHFKGHPSVDDSGRLEMVGAVTDITEHKHAEHKLRNAFEEIQRLKDRLQDENLALREQIDQAFMFEEIVGSSPALQSVLTSIVKVAPTDSTV